jgi:hypothetical protein
MLTADLGQRALRLADLTEILCRQALLEDRDLVLALAPVIVAAMPDRLALSLTSATLAARILDHFPPPGALRTLTSPPTRSSSAAARATRIASRCSQPLPRPISPRT